MVDMLVGLGLKHEVIDAILVLNRSSSERELDRKNEKSGLCPFMRKDGLILVQMRCYTWLKKEVTFLDNGISILEKLIKDLTYDVAS